MVAECLLSGVGMDRGDRMVVVRIGAELAMEVRVWSDQD